MTTAMISHTGDHATMGRPAIAAQPFPTLLRVEVRKLIDTRSGKLLLAAAVTLAAGLLTWKVTHTGDIDVRFSSYNQSVTASLAFILPILGLLAMTSEWTQRTALTTFTMSPRRLRVFGAKFLAALLLSSVVLVCTTVMTFGATALGGAISGNGASYAHLGLELRSTIVITLLQVIMGAAFGALIPLTAVALGAFVVAPTVWAAAAPELLKGSSRWLDVFEAYDRLGSAHPGQHMAQTVTAIAAWVVAPAAIGLYRSLHREVK